jgi:hypothetical protein
MNEATIRQQLEAHSQGRYLDSNGKESWCFNFYDWFCKESSLQKKADTLFGQLKRFLAANPSIDIDKHYVWFKNNCPVNGPLYDDFRIADIVTGDTMYTVTAKCGHSGLAEAYSRANGFNKPIATGKNFTEMLKNIVS